MIIGSVVLSLCLRLSADVAFGNAKQRMNMEHAGYILVVDDDSTIGELIAEMLTDEGLSVLAVSSGAQALPAISAHLPLVCLIEPCLSGLEVIEHLRAHSAKDLPIVVMTASRQVAEALRAVGFDCLDKPFDIDDLLVCVARYVSPQLLTIAVSV